MALSYEEALATLQSMFSDQGYTSQDLDAVLRHHGGHMENTVETLLSHGDGSPSDLLSKLSGGSATSDNTADIDADEALARQLQGQLAAEDERQRPSRNRSAQNQSQGLASRTGRSNFPSARSIDSAAGSRNTWPSRVASKPRPPAGTKGIGTPTNLPADFLRIPGKTYSSESVATTAASTPAGAEGQMMSDEQLARMLQDKLFQEELLNNPEFSHLAGRRNPRTNSGSGNSSRMGEYPGQQSGRPTYSGSGGGAASWGERPDFFDRLSELGNDAKSRFRQLAANWNDPDRASRPFFGGGQGAAAPQQQQRGNERRGLLSSELNLDEEEEEEMDFVGGNSVEMQDKYAKKKD